MQLLCLQTSQKWCRLLPLMWAFLCHSGSSVYESEIFLLTIFLQCRKYKQISRWSLCEFCFLSPLVRDDCPATGISEASTSIRDSIQARLHIRFASQTAWTSVWNTKCSITRYLENFLIELRRSGSRILCWLIWLHINGFFDNLTETSKNCGGTWSLHQLYRTTSCLPPSTFPYLAVSLSLLDLESHFLKYRSARSRVSTRWVDLLLLTKGLNLFVRSNRGTTHRGPTFWTMRSFMTQTHRALRIMAENYPLFSMTEEIWILQ